MITAEDIRNEQTRRETTSGETFEADYGYHTINKVVKLTEANGSKATGELFGFYWQAYGDWNGHMCVIAHNPHTDEEVTKTYPLSNINGELDIQTLIGRILRPQLYGV